MSAPRRTARYMRDLVRIGQRWRHKQTGVVLIVRNIHAADQLIEAVYERPRPMVGFGELRDRYELIGNQP